MHLGKAFGTRHRAALGITEETDAVSIVVSEERGAMSLCFEGRMSKNLDLESLRKALYGLFSEEKNRERRKAAEERKVMVPAMPKKGRRDSVTPPPGEVVLPETLSDVVEGGDPKTQVLDTRSSQTDLRDSSSEKRGEK
jgi:hypothetical protein